MMFKKLSKPRRILAISAIAFAGIILLLFLSAEFTSRPKFCITCHYMQPFYDSWISSTHKDVNCTKCHYSPGFKSFIDTKTVGLVHLVTYITQFYKRSKPAAEIEDASCLRSGCHDKRLLKGKEKYGRVYFDHEPHLTGLRRGKQLRCTSCHSQIVQGDHMKVTTSTCFICHFKTGPGDPDIHDCNFCHDAPTTQNSEGDVTYDHANVLDENIECQRCHTQMVVGDGSVPLENCYNCHWEQERLDRHEEVDFMHKMHITDHKIECQRCHTIIQHKLPEQDDLHLLDCSSCHAQPHKAQVELFSGEGGYNVHKVPNPMFSRSITCKGCHIFHAEEKTNSIDGKISKADRQSCGKCHGKGFERLLQQWKSSTQKKLVQSLKIYNSVNREVSRVSSPNKMKAQKLLEEAKYNYDIVDKGKSVHNVQFADELLRGAHGNLQKALELVSSRMKIGSYPETSKDVPATCNSCHFGVETHAKPVFGMKFSHENHVVNRKQECQLCHSNERRHGEFIMRKSQCAACHHKTRKEDCASCHSIQSAIYSGSLKNSGYDIEADYMHTGEVACSDCHDYASNSTMTPAAKHCLNCHDDESYEDFNTEWQESTAESVKFIGEWLSHNNDISLTAEQKTQLDKIRNLLHLVATDGSNGVHNSSFFIEALTQSKDILEQIHNE